jgi:hypothetical protein
LLDQWSGLRAVAGKSLFVANDTFNNDVSAHFISFRLVIRDPPAGFGGSAQIANGAQLSCLSPRYDDFAERPILDCAPANHLEPIGSQ